MDENSNKRRLYQLHLLARILYATLGFNLTFSAIAWYSTPKDEVTYISTLMIVMVLTIIDAILYLSLTMLIKRINKLVFNIAMIFVLINLFLPWIEPYGIMSTFFIVINGILLITMVFLYNQFFPLFQNQGNPGIPESGDEVVDIEDFEELADEDDDFGNMESDPHDTEESDHTDK
jgi:predicted membrane channel-forming protein YqfA (hemolysin III family)